MKRKEFLKLVPFSLSAVFMHACFRSPQSNGDGTEIPDDNSLLILQMTGDHTHNRINVPKDLVDDGKGGSFKLTGGNHGHTFLLKDFEMQSIKNGQQVFVSTIGSDHIHTFYLQKKPETLGPKLT